MHSSTIARKGINAVNISDMDLLILKDTIIANIIIMGPRVAMRSSI